MNPVRYAQKTKVPVENTRMDIEKLLTRAGASQFAFARDSDNGFDRMLFRLVGRMIKIEVRHPTTKEVPSRTHDRHKALDQIYRQRWRAQLLIVKAKLEIIAMGLSTVDREFLADMYLPNGRTLGDEMIPRLNEAYETGRFNATTPFLLGPGMS